VEDPVVQSAAGTGTIPSTIANFEGMGTGLSGFTVQSAPPDTVGDIGPDHYVQIVNYSLTIFSRTGSVVLGPIPTSHLWSGFRGACSETNDGDATIRFDQLAGRWVIGQFSVNRGVGPFYQCVAVSTSADPTGTYNRYQFGYAAFNDYPKLGVWSNAYYFTFNTFVNNEFTGSRVCAMNRAKMVAGGAAVMHCFDTAADYGGLLAADLDGKTAPPAAEPSYIVAYGTNELQVWRMRADFGNPSNTSFTGPTLIPVAAFTPLCNGGTCVKQPGSTQLLDSLADRLMNRFAYRRFPTHASMVVSQTVTAGIASGVRWYELRATAGAAATLFQQGTYAPDSSYRFMSSVAMDGTGNIALGFAISSSTVSPGIRYTGRLAGDAPGTLGQGEGTIVAGFGAQIAGLSRFGDYSSLNIDPKDDCTFWYTQEYIGLTGAFNWRSRVGSFKFPSCGTASSDFSLTATPTSATLAAGASTSFTIDTSVLSGGAQSINLSIAGSPAGVTASFNPSTVTPGSSSTLTISAAANAAAGAAQLAVIGQSGSTSHTANIALTVTSLTVAPSQTEVTLEAPAVGARDEECGTKEVRSWNQPLSIPDNSANGVRSSLDFAGPGVITTMSLSLKLSHPFRGDLVVEFVSPGGARWPVARRAGGATRDLTFENLPIRAFVGDHVAGTWQLQIADRAGHDEGTLDAWSLTIERSCSRASSWSASASPDLPIIDAGNVCSTVIVPSANAGNASDAKLDLRGRHDHRSSLRGTLAHNGTTVPAFSIGTFATASRPFGFANRAVPGFRGAAAGAWTLCIIDADAFGDTGTLRSWAVHD
jgi:subtilisin-like proprotein convertase family protein